MDFRTILVSLILSGGLVVAAQATRSILLDQYTPDIQITWDNKSPYDSFNITKFGPDETNKAFISLLFTSIILKTNDSFTVQYTTEKGEVKFETFSEDKTPLLEVIGATDFFLEKSDWNKSLTSSVTFLFTLYKELKSSCGLGYFQCSYSQNKQCGDPKTKKSLLEAFDIELLDVETLNKDALGKDESSEEKEDSKKTYRCIPQSLKCNGHNNCGQSCLADEGECDKNSSGDNGVRNSWYDIQYLLTILLAGLFFILSPICIVIFLFYHRRMSAARELNMRRGTVGHLSEIYTTSPPNDMPPSYEDVHDIKTPPPPFEFATSSSRTPASHPGTSTSN